MGRDPHLTVMCLNVTHQVMRYVYSKVMINCWCLTSRVFPSYYIIDSVSMDIDNCCGQFIFNIPDDTYL